MEVLVTYRFTKRCSHYWNAISLTETAYRIACYIARVGFGGRRFNFDLVHPRFTPYELVLRIGIMEIQGKKRLGVIEGVEMSETTGVEALPTGTIIGTDETKRLDRPNVTDPEKTPRLHSLPSAAQA